MISDARRWCEGATAWWVRRNPAYLLSAAAMALGARLLLVSPDARAGDLWLILLTLGVLLAYELAITGIVIALHHTRRGLDDLPSLLLVGALFWTGPLCATIELTAQDGSLGLPFSLAAAGMTLLMLTLVCRELGVRLTAAGATIATCCVVLLAVIPPRLRLTYLSGATDETLLYACWWMLAGLTLGMVSIIRRRFGNERFQLDASAMLRRGDAELAFVGSALAATALHLYGMNYAFFAHARLFYVAPLMIAAALVGFELVHHLRPPGSWLTAIPIAVLTLAIAIGAGEFDPAVLPAVIPWPARDPLIGTAMFGALVYWRACRLTRLGWLVHAGTAALVLSVYRGMLEVAPLPAIAPQPGFAPVGVHSYEIARAAYLVALYFAVLAWSRRSRFDAVLAIAAHAVALCAMIEPRTAHAPIVFTAVAAWSWLFAVAAIKRHPHLGDLLIPLAGVMGVTMFAEFEPDLAMYARVNGAVALAALYAAALIWPRGPSRAAAILATAGLGGF